MTRLFLIIVVLAHFCVSPIQADTLPTPADTVSYPGLSEVVPQASALSDQVNSTRQRLESLSGTKELQKLLEQEQQTYAVLMQRIASYGPVENWYIDRQLAVSSQLKFLDTTLDNLQQQISKKLKEVDQLDSLWKTRKDYWQNWQINLQQTGIKIPVDTFKRAKTQISTTLDLTGKSNQPLVELQQQVLALQETVQGQINLLEDGFKKLRKNLLQRNGYSLFSSDYWRQFTPELLQTARQQIGANLQINDDFYSKNALLICLQFLLAIAVTGLIYRYSSTIAQSTRWQIFSNHPLATGGFTAIALISFFYQGMPPHFRLLIVCLGLLFAVQLCISFLEVRAIRFYLYSFSLLALTTFTLRMVGLPLPYYRIYLIALDLALITILIVLCGQLKKSGKLKGLFLLRLMGALLGFSLLTNLSGHVALSFRLTESSIESVIVVLFAALAYQVGLGGLTFLISRFTTDNSKIKTGFGHEFQLRFERLFFFLLIAYSCFYLTAVWGFFSSPGKAWETLTSISLTISNYQFSVSTAFQVILVFYLSMELSWVLQSLLDKQLFDRRQYDRGVRDAVKKLLHYSLVLIGLLFAAVVAGFELQNLMVLAGAFGIGIGFGLQNIVNNFLSGIIMLFERPIKVGDGILVDGDYGTVLRIGLRSTVVETLDHAELIVPNSQLISEKLTNWTLSNRRVRLVIPVGVAYGSDSDLVLKILADAGETHPDVLSEPKTSPIFVQFGDSSLDFELRVWISNVDNRPRVKSELLLYIDQKFREAGVEIPFPQRDLHLRSVKEGVLAAGLTDKKLNKE